MNVDEANANTGGSWRIMLVLVAATRGAGALPAFRELWLLLGGLALMGLGLTWLIGGNRPVAAAEGV